MTAIGDPEALRSTADRFDSVAAEVADVGTEGYNQLMACEFEAPVAVALVNSALDRRTKCTAQAAELMDLGRVLRAHADWIDDTMAEIRRVEARIIAWESANPVGSSPTGADASLIGTWPASGSLEWLDVAERLRRQGVAF